MLSVSPLKELEECLERLTGASIEEIRNTPVEHPSVAGQSRPTLITFGQHGDSYLMDREEVDRLFAKALQS